MEVISLNAKNEYFIKATAISQDTSALQPMTAEELVTVFQMSDSKAKETARNDALTKVFTGLRMMFHEYTNGKLASKKQNNLIYTLGTKVRKQHMRYLPFLVELIALEKIDTETRLNAALKYLLDNLNEAGLPGSVIGTNVNYDRFKEACGIGINVDDDEISRVVGDAIKRHEKDLLEKRYRFNNGIILGYIRGLPRMCWADGGKVKIEVDKQVLKLLGPKTAEDEKPLAKEKKPDGNKKPQTAVVNAKKEVAGGDAHSDSLTPQERIMASLKKLQFHKPGENYTTEGYPTSQVALDLLKAHVKKTGGQVRTRFPPEPNGILHIGHAKAININFGYAKAHNGTCNLRYDDTNPEKEEERFFLSIREMVDWLGYQPAEITHASDNFDQLYEFAKTLIKKGLAFVCHQTADQMKGFTTETSPWRDRSVELNLQLFEDMKNGKFEEGEATLRMKITLEEGKQDPVAYRVRYVPHPKSGDKWCIYPTYDFTHCLCDSLENITHSMCTKEFQNRRSSYYWLCEAVETYIPVQWEYGRLNMCYTVVSKRKIAKLITEGIVTDWDDPRLFTLPALRRRGFPPEAVNDFCVRMGVTGATIMVEPAMLDACVRDILNVTAPRTMVVIEPLKITLKDFPFPVNYKIAVPDFPSESTSKTHDVVLKNVIYIERSDFREKEDKGYKRFSKDQTVGLRHAGLVLTCNNIITNSSGDIVEIVASCKKIGEAPKPKGFIQWVSDPAEVEVRLYERLFNHKHPEDPEEVPGGFLSDCNRNSLKIEKALADKYLLGAKPFTQYQFERTGFFSVDPDSTNSRLVFNRTVTLKEDNEKN